MKVDVLHVKTEITWWVIHVLVHDIIINFLRRLFPCPSVVQRSVMFLERGKQFLYSIHVPYFSIPLTRGRRESRLSTDSLTCNCKGIRNPESTYLHIFGLCNWESSPCNLASNPFWNLKCTVAALTQVKTIPGKQSGIYKSYLSLYMVSVNRK